MFVKLLSHTADGEKIAAIAGKLCYSSGGYEKIAGTLNDETIASFISKINDLGHYSVLEHMSFSFIVEARFNPPACAPQNSVIFPAEPALR